MASTTKASSKRPGPGFSKAKPHWFSLAIGDRAFVPGAPEPNWLPVVEGYLVHTPGAVHTPFAGTVPGTDVPVTGTFLNLPWPDGLFDSKPVGRPRTAAQRDVAIFLAYTAFELFNPTLRKEDLRALVVKAWAGNLPSHGCTKTYRGITDNQHVKRSMQNALRHAPELAAPLRSEKNLPLFNADDTLAGAVLEFHGTRGIDWQLLFSPVPKGLSGTPMSKNGIDGLLFSNEDVWVWRVGEEFANKYTCSTWRPSTGHFKITAYTR